MYNLINYQTATTSLIIDFVDTGQNKLIDLRVTGAGGGGENTAAVFRSCRTKIDVPECISNTSLHSATRRVTISKLQLRSLLHILSLIHN